jgi:hexokinase
MNSKLLTAAIIASSSTIVGLFTYFLYDSYRTSSKKLQHTERALTLKRYKRGKLKTEQIEKRLNKLNLDTQTLRQIMEIFERDIKKGLDPFTNSESDLKMLPTYVCSLPSGKESGDILALDLGGSNFRVVLVHLKPGTKPQKTDKVFILPERLIKGSGEKVRSIHNIKSAKH